MSAPNTSIDLPAFYCPIEPAIHPRAEQLEQQAIAWIDAFGLCPDEAARRHAIGSNSAEAVCRISPDAADDERLLLFVEWVYWGFILDEQHEQTRGLLSSADITDLSCRMIGCLEAPGSRLLGDDGYALALEDIVRRMHLAATPTQVRRFIDAMRRYLIGVIWETNNRARQATLSLQDFTVQRLSTCAGAPVFALMEFAAGAEIPGREFDALTVRAVTEAATLVTAWDNDIYSYAKEREQRHGEQGHNIVDVIAHQSGGTTEQALAEAVAMRDRAMTFFLTQREHIRATASPELAHYLDNLGHAIRSNIEWSVKAPRYTSQTGPICVTWAEHPSDASTDPLPNPAVAWWWRLADDRAARETRP